MVGQAPVLRGPLPHRRLRLALTRGLLAASAALALWACAPAGQATTGFDPVALAMLDHVNAARAQARSCGDVRYPAAGPLRLNARLSAAAQAHSDDMRRRGVLSHTGSDGSSVVERVERQGYDWSRLAENVAWGYEDVGDVVAGWLDSPGHCRNIMDGRYTELGVGLAGTYWTQVFGAPG